MDSEKQREVQKSKNIETQLVMSLIKNGLFLQRKLGQVCQQFNLNTNQFLVINEIILKGPLSQKELCNRLLFEKSNISKIIKTLQDKELISVSVAPADRRSTLLIETVKGIEIWKDCLQSFNHSSADLMTSLSDRELLDILELLKKTGQSFSYMESQ
ncbi:MarR family winged helix-turn-helix transcriptional regulator [Desulfopila sp. IMCC35008]|uniref:MarR family winged helix-turn-helix transcriptional regulator n=1 Tax=Desulfopila sp. IMCC35008 TaxID=2653858 RepID=UPI0013D31EFD|nr:MarR family transcriptional regulator [Desulfopila sp. IMCC35008]